MKREQSKHKKTKIYMIAGTFSVAGCILMVVFPELALNAADRGLALFLNSVLPSLLPFFICANFMIALGVPAVIGCYFESLFQKLFRAPGCSAFVFIISITSGYPMGAKLIGDMGRRGEITIEQGKQMLSFCTTSGPLFMLATVGTSMLGYSKAGIAIALSHYAAAILNGLLFRFFLRNERSESNPKQTISKSGIFINPSSDLLEEFTRSILSSFRTLAVICGYIVLFTLLSDFLQFSGALSLFDAAYEKGLVKGLLEMTIGAGAIASDSTISMVMKCALCALLISFGGISIAAQSISMLSGFEISVWYYLKVKFCHGMIAFFLAIFISPFLLNQPVTVGAFADPSITKSLGSFYGLLFSTKMVIMILVLFVITTFIQNIIDRIQQMRMRKKKEEKN